jgi:hypothetical protein
MFVEKIVVTEPRVIPLIAALPYAVRADRDELETSSSYDANSQLSRFAGGRNYSICRYEESVNPLFGKSRSDTQKDD